MNDKNNPFLNDIPSLLRALADIDFLEGDDSDFSQMAGEEQQAACDPAPQESDASSDSR